MIAYSTLLRASPGTCSQFTRSEPSSASSPAVARTANPAAAPTIPIMSGTVRSRGLMTRPATRPITM